MNALLPPARRIAVVNRAIVRRRSARFGFFVLGGFPALVVCDDGAAVSEGEGVDAIAGSGFASFASSAATPETEGAPPNPGASSGAASLERSRFNTGSVLTATNASSFGDGAGPIASPPVAGADAGAEPAAPLPDSGVGVVTEAPFACCASRASHACWCAWFRASCISCRSAVRRTAAAGRCVSVFSRSRPEGRLGCRDPRDPAPGRDPFGIPAPGSGALCTRRRDRASPAADAWSCRASPPPRRACRSRCSASSMSRARRLSASATDAPGRAPPPRATASPRNGPSVFIAPEVPRLRNARSRAYGSSAGTPPELSCVPLCALAASELAASWAARASSGTASASAVISATVDGRPSNFCSSGASGVSVPPSRLEMNSTVLCRLMICSCAARRRATVAAVASASPASTSSACRFASRRVRRAHSAGRARETGETTGGALGPFDARARATER